jgi:hypothetical protein
LAAYLLYVQKLKKDFDILDLHHIPQAENAVADDRSTKAFTWVSIPDGVFKRRLQQLTTLLAELGKRGDTSASKLEVSAALILWNSLRIIGVKGDSVHPGAQDSEAQVFLVHGS